VDLLKTFIMKTATKSASKATKQPEKKADQKESSSKKTTAASKSSGAMGKPSNASGKQADKMMKNDNGRSSNGAAKKTASNSRGNASKGGQSTQAKSNDGKLKEFFIDELKDIYWAEKHLTKTLPKMKKAATSTELQNAFTDHLEATTQHVQRLEQAFEMLGERAVAKKCEAMAGITEEGEGIIDETDAGTATRDVGLILAAQKVEHYEISTYGGLAQLAHTLGLEEVAEILETTLAEEKETDQLLTQIAENNINYQAGTEGEEDGEEEEDDDTEDEEEEDEEA
jgi:ferritin-like metal-binding protein YciE